MISDEFDEKAAARLRAKAQRSAVSAAHRKDAGDKAAAFFLDSIPLPPGSSIAAFWPLGDEFDSRPLITALLAAGHPLALPVVVGAGQPLVFRAWKPNDDMAVSSFGVSEPLQAAPVLQPKIVVVPFLAYNAQGFRLGYGGGYYDRTLRALRQTAVQQTVSGLLAVGLGFAAQEVATLPHDNNDEPLDWLITERGVQKFMF